MNPTKKSDLNLSVVATSIGAGCALLVVLYALVISVGSQIGRRGHMVGLAALVIGIAVHCTVGYVTGRTARAKRAPVNFHVIFVGVLVMLLSLAVLKAPLVGANPRNWGEFALMIRIINILLTIPAMWLGANWYRSPATITRPAGPLGDDDGPDNDTDGDFEATPDEAAAEMERPATDVLKPT